MGYLINAGDAVRAYILHGDNQQASVFATNLNHAEALAECFDRYGYNSAVISAELRPLDRRMMLQRWYAGRLRIAVGIMENWPEFAAPVSIVCRPTRSSVLHETSYSQVTRLVLDFVGNVRANGVPCWYKGHILQSVNNAATLEP